MKYLYYHLWQLFTKIKTNDMPATNAMIFISMCEFANIFVGHIFLNQFSFIEINIVTKYDIYFFTISIGILIYTINYFYLYRYRNKLHEKYKNETKKQKVIGNILLILYVLGSFALVFYFGTKYSASVMKQVKK